MVEILNTETSVTPSPETLTHAPQQDDEYVVRQVTTVKVADDVHLSKVAEAVAEATQEQPVSSLEELLLSAPFSKLPSTL